VLYNSTYTVRTLSKLLYAKEISNSSVEVSYDFGYGVCIIYIVSEYTDAFNSIHYWLTIKQITCFGALLNLTSLRRYGFVDDPSSEDTSYDYYRYHAKKFSYELIDEHKVTVVDALFRLIDREFSKLLKNEDPKVMNGVMLYKQYLNDIITAHQLKLMQSNNVEQHMQELIDNYDMCYCRLLQSDIDKFNVFIYMGQDVNTPIYRYMNKISVVYREDNNKLNLTVRMPCIDEQELMHFTLDTSIDRNFCSIDKIRVDAFLRDNVVIHASSYDAACVFNFDKMFMISYTNTTTSKNCMSKGICRDCTPNQIEEIIKNINVTLRKISSINYMIYSN